MKTEIQIVSINDNEAEIVLDGMADQQRDEYMQFLALMIELCPYTEPSNTMH